MLCFYTYTSFSATKSTNGSASLGLHGWSFTNFFVLYLCYFLQLRNFSNIILIFLLFLYFRGKCNILIFCFSTGWMYLWMHLLHRVFDKNLFFFCYFTSFPLPTFCFSSYFSASAFSFFVLPVYPHRSRGLSQSSEWGVLPGPGLSGEMSLRRHSGRLLQSQTDPCSSTHPWTHHRPVSQLLVVSNIHNQCIKWDTGPEKSIQNVISL